MSARRPFNARILRAAALLPAFTAGALFAADTPAAPDTALSPAAVVPSGNAPAAHAPAKPGVQATAPAVVSGASPTKENAPVNLGKTVVVASRHEENLDDVSPSVSVITVDEIEIKQFRMLSDALASMPGVMVSGAGSPGSNISVFTRGTNSNDTAVLLDGRQLNPGMDGSYEMQRYSLTGLSSVEMLRGAASTLYGANAIGGVIDMRTLDPLATTLPVSSGMAEGGSFGYRGAGVTMVGRSNQFSGGDTPDFGISFSAFSDAQDGYRPNSDLERTNAVANVQARVTDSLTFETLTEVNQSKPGLPGSVENPSLVDRLDLSGWLVSPRVRFDNGDDFTAHLFYSYSHSNLASDIPENAAYFAPTDTLATTDKQEVTFTDAWKISSAVLLASGYTYTDTRYDRADTVAGAQLFARDWESHSPWARIEFTPGEGNQDRRWRALPVVQ